MAYVERDIENEIFRWIDEREVIALRGPRQSGKTTLLERIKEVLITKGVKEKQAVFLTFEDNFLRMNFEENPAAFIKSYLMDESKYYFLLDEVQYVNDVGKKIKLIYDTVPNIKIIITGSSSFDLTNLRRYLVGRVLFFDITPFSFHEFLKIKGERFEKLYRESHIDIKNPKLKGSLFLNELNPLLREFLTYGSYPRIALTNEPEKKKELLKNMFTTFIEKEIAGRFEFAERDSVIRLLKLLSSTSGIIKYESLSQGCGLRAAEIKKVVALLEDTYAITVVKPFFKNKISELRKNPKIYFVDYGIRNYLAERIDSPDFGVLYENFACNQLKRKHKVNYWRTTAKTEVDFVIDGSIPLEVKSTNRATRALRSFIESYHPSFAYVASYLGSDGEHVNDAGVIHIPLVYL